MRVLLDLGLPGRNGSSLLPEIRARWPQLAVVVITMDDEDSSVRTALHRGALGYLLKDAGAAELHRALKAGRPAVHSVVLAQRPAPSADRR